MVSIKRIRKNAGLSEELKKEKNQRPPVSKELILKTGDFFINKVWDVRTFTFLIVIL